MRIGAIRPGRSQNGGSDTTILTVAQMPAHSHPLPAPANTDPTRNTITGLTVDEGSTGNTIGQAHLEFTDAEEAAPALTFTLDNAPANARSN